MILENIKNPNDVKKLNIDELTLLCEELRDVIINTVSNNGGHLASNLGTIETIVALAYVFDFNKDKIIFDVGHQSYAYKILTSRFEKFSTIRKKGGLSGFPDIFESEFDAYSVGHSGTSISAGLGYAFSRDKLKDDYFIISLVGDASFFNGINLEALSSSSVKPNKFIVILNDNGMSISKNNNGLYKFISKITVKKGYNSLNSFLGKTIGKCFIGKFLRKIKRFLKRGLSKNTISDVIGLKYVGRFDGHNLKALINIFNDLKETQISTLLHLKTIKGKGLVVAENDSTKFHGVSKNLLISENYFSKNISDILNDIYQNNDKIVAITAGMMDGVGLADFAKLHPENFIDVGIAEEYAVSLAGGIAISGLKPIVFIYSTFLQRGYDQIVEDVCLQNLPCVFMIDRAGLVGEDGKTHQGVFDISYLSHVPNLKIFAPKDIFDLKNMLNVALNLNCPVAIRYPNGKNEYNFSNTSNFDSNLRWEILNKGDKNTILCVGPRMINLALETLKNTKSDLEIVSVRSIKPLDSEYLLLNKDKNLIVLEENVKNGGVGSLILNFYNEYNLTPKIKICSIKDEFISHSTINDQLQYNELTVNKILEFLK